MKLIVQLVRVLVGLLFVFSGWVKLNDPVGFSFKLEEYFSEGVLNLPFLMPLALSISIVIVIFEVLLGVFLLVGYRLKWTFRSLLVMIVFFSFLTFYSAYFNKVTDCGCFGDAIKLTPWQSFTKDIILLVFILFLKRFSIFVLPFKTKRFRTRAVFIALLFSVVYVYYVLNHLPIVDFRAYKIGVNIPAQMEIPENAPKAIYEYHWKFKIDGQEQIITTQGNYPTVTGDFIAVETQEIQKGYEPPIHDFSIEKDGEDFSDTYLSKDKLLVIVSYDLSIASAKGLTSLNKLIASAKEKNYEVILLSASLTDQMESVKKTYGLDVESYNTDQTALKTIVRSNPAALVLSKGTIIAKKHFNDFKKLQLN